MSYWTELRKTVESAVQKNILGTKFQELFSPKSFWLSDCQAPPLHVSYNVAFLIPGCELIHNYGKNKYTMCFTQTLQHYLPALSF